MYATVKRKKIIFYAASVIAAACLIALIFSVRSAKTKADKNDLNSICVSFLAEKKVRLAEKTPQSIETAVLAKDFSEVMTEYNGLQKKQGFDLSLYAGKTVIKYTYPVRDKKRSDIVAVVFLYGGRVIGGDIHCIGADGYMTGFDGETIE